MHGAWYHDEWFDNVMPLIDSLKAIGVDPLEWAKSCDEDVFFTPGCPKGIILKIPHNKLTCHISQIYIAMGYMTAVANIYGMGWHQQIAEALDTVEEEDDDEE